jgi:hypothetical protein
MGKDDTVTGALRERCCARYETGLAGCCNSSPGGWQPQTLAHSPTITVCAGRNGTRRRAYSNGFHFRRQDRTRTNRLLALTVPAAVKCRTMAAGVALVAKKATIEIRPSERAPGTVLVRRPSLSSQLAAGLTTSCWLPVMITFISGMRTGQPCFQGHEGIPPLTAFIERQVLASTARLFHCVLGY